MGKFFGNVNLALKKPPSLKINIKGLFIKTRRWLEEHDRTQTETETQGIDKDKTRTRAGKRTRTGKGKARTRTRQDKTRQDKTRQDKGKGKTDVKLKLDLKLTMGCLQARLA